MALGPKMLQLTIDQYLAQDVSTVGEVFAEVFEFLDSGTVTVREIAVQKKDRVAIMRFVVVDLMHCPDGEIGAKVVAQDCLHCALIFI